MELKFDSDGLIPAICQDAGSGQVLMVAWMNPEALQLTVEHRQAHFWSRSRQELWHKGATSGNYLKVLEVWTDCDSDSLLLKVIASGPACHTGEGSCFHQQII
jgi:phosphoribosyl-AMP cyclohydrolase